MKSFPVLSIFVLLAKEMQILLNLSYITRQGRTTEKRKTSQNEEITQFL